MTALGGMQNPARGILHGLVGLVSAEGLVALVSRWYHRHPADRIRGCKVRVIYGNGLYLEL